MKKLLLILLILAIAGCVQNIEGPPVEYKAVDYKGLPNLGIETYVPVLFQNERYAEMPLKVYISKQGESLTGLHGTASDDVRYAMESIENQTNGVISFVEVNNPSDADMNVSWVSEEQSLEPGTSVIGRGGSDYVIDTGLFNLSDKGYVYLSSHEAYCTSRIVHEFGHVLGLDHVENEYDVMYYLIHCGRQLSNDAIRTFQNLYKTEPLPELYFYNISAIKTGSNYTISFEVKNAGLINSKNTSVILEGDGKEMQNFVIPEIKPGWGYIYSWWIIKLDNYKTLKLTIDPKNSFSELDKENNVIVLQGSNV